MKISEADKNLIETYHKARGVGEPSLTLPDLLTVFRRSDNKVRQAYKVEMRSYLRLLGRGQIKVGQPIMEAKDLV